MYDMSASDWMKKAEEDFEAAEAMKNSEFYSQAAFLYQQSAEKALKAVLIDKEKGLKQTHDCFILAKDAEAGKEIKDAANSLSPYYFRTRYPDAGLLDLTEEEIQEIAGHGEVILKWAKKR
jgi:HEPN domain-containing protein